jgi:hypothetical protein
MNAEDQRSSHAHSPVLEAAKKMMPKEFLDMFTWIREKGFKANIAEVRQKYPQLLTFAGWVKKYSDEH